MVAVLVGKSRSRYLIFLLASLGILFGVNGQFTVTIVSSAPGIPVSGSANTFDYSVLSSVTLTCMVEPTPSSAVTYQWNTLECYTHPSHNNGNLSCFPLGQTAQSITGTGLNAQDAGTITCTVTISGINYTSELFTLRISGATFTRRYSNDIRSYTAYGNYRYFYDYINTNQIASCVTGLGPSDTDDNSALGGLYFNGNKIPYGTCGDSETPTYPIQATITNLPGVIDIHQCTTQLTLADEGIYTCIMTNSSMMNESLRFGVYISGRNTLQIDNPISPTVAVVGSSLTLSCTSRRSPPNTFTWRRVYLNLFLQSTRIIALDYTNTSAVFRAEYTIHNITTSDSDIYDCIAENPRSSAIRGIRVDVNVPTPNVSISLTNTQILGQSLTLHCKVTTVRGITTSVDIMWHSGGTTLQRNYDVSSTTVNNSLVYTGTYTISLLSTTDDGRVIHCEVVIDGASPSVVANESITLDVTNPNTTITVTAPNTQTVGQSLTLQCEVTTVKGITRRVDIAWSSRGTILRSMYDVSSTAIDNSLVYTLSYTISQLSTTDDGRVIQCEVVINTNPSVMATDSITLDVNVPTPTVTISPSGPIQGAMVGSPQVINCVVSTVSGVESSTVMISWLGPGGGSIISDSRVTISPTTSISNTYTSSLRFIYLVEEDEGDYSCDVMILETWRSESFMLQSLIIPYPDLTLTTDITPTLYQPLTLQCEAAIVRGVTSRVDVVWVRIDNDSEVELQRMEGATSTSAREDDLLLYTDSYTTAVLSVNDNNAVYKCIVSISDQQQVLLNTSLNVSLNIIFIPGIAISPSGPIQGAMVGSSQNIQCTVSTVSGVESSSVIINWMGPGGGSIISNDRLTISPTTSSADNYTSSLQFTYLMEEDEGTYTCNVMILGARGSESIKFGSLTIPTPTVIVTAPNTQTVGQSLTLQCEVTTVRGITSRVDIVWSSVGTVLRRINNVSSTIMDNALVYRDSYTISQLSTTDDGRVIQCEVVINTNPPIQDDDNIALYLTAASTSDVQSGSNDTNEITLTVIVLMAVVILLTVGLIVTIVIIVILVRKAKAKKGKSSQTIEFNSENNNEVVASATKYENININDNERQNAKPFPVSKAKNNDNKVYENADAIELKLTKPSSS